MTTKTATCLESLEPDAAAPSEPHGGLWSRDFIGLLITQFLGAMNDNIFRWLVVPIGKDLVSPQYKGAAVAAGLALLVLPFILLAGPAGYLADRFSKQKVIVGCKIAEVVIMILGVAAILYGDVYVMFVVLFLMGAQSALFGPSKYGAIPELVRADRISAANGLIGMTTILAIVLGTVIGGYLYYWTEPLGHTHWWIYAVTVVGVAGVGTATSLLIRPLRSANPTQPFSFNFLGQALGDLATLASHRSLFVAAGASALFWSLAGLCQVNVDVFATGDLGVAQQHVGPLLAVLALGVGAGNILAAVWSRGGIDLRLVPCGAAGIALGGVLLSTVPGGDGTPTSAAYLLSAGWLFLLGLGAGAYDVPLQSFLQARSPAESRGAILASSSFLTFTGTILASGVFYLLNTVLGLSGRSIFLVAGLPFLPVIALALWFRPRNLAAASCEGCANLD